MTVLFVFCVHFFVNIQCVGYMYYFCARFPVTSIDVTRTVDKLSLVLSRLIFIISISFKNENVLVTIMGMLRYLYSSQRMCFKVPIIWYSTKCMLNWPLKYPDREIPGLTKKKDYYTSSCVDLPNLKWVYFTKPYAQIIYRTKQRSNGICNHGTSRGQHAGLGDNRFNGKPLF